MFGSVVLLIAGTQWCLRSRRLTGSS